MGVSYWSQIVYGVTLERKRVTRTVKRFNERTGEPYEKQETYWAWLVPDSSSILEVHLDYDETLHADISNDFDDLTEKLVHGDQDYRTIIGIAATDRVYTDDAPIGLPKAFDVEYFREELRDTVGRRFGPAVAEAVLYRASLILYTTGS